MPQSMIWLPGPKRCTSKPLPVRTSTAGASICWARRKSASVVPLKFSSAPSTSATTSRAARDRREGGNAGAGRVVQRPVVVMDHDAHRANFGMAREGLQAMAQHRLAGELGILLRRGSAEAAAAAGRDDQGDGMDERHAKRSLAGIRRDDH